MCNKMSFLTFRQRCKNLLGLCDDLSSAELEVCLRQLREDFRNITDTAPNVEQARIALNLTSSVIEPRIPQRACN